MTFDFSQLSSADFALGAFGATFVEICRLKRLLYKNGGQVRASKLQWSISIICFFLFVVGSGLLAAVQGVSPLLSAFYAGLTSPIFFSVILRDNASAERELIEKVEKPKNEELALKNTEITKKEKKIKYQKQEIYDLRTQQLKLRETIAGYSQQQNYNDKLIKELASRISETEKELLLSTSAKVKFDMKEQIKYLTSRLVYEILLADRQPTPPKTPTVIKVSGEAIGIEVLGEAIGIEVLGEARRSTEFEDATVRMTELRKDQATIYSVPIISRIVKRSLRSLPSQFASFGFLLLFLVMITVSYLLFSSANLNILAYVGISFLSSVVANKTYDIAHRSKVLQRIINGIL